MAIRAFTKNEIAVIRANAAKAALDLKVQGLVAPEVIGAHLPMDARMAERAVDIAYYANGGEAWFSVWAGENPTEFFKSFLARRIAKSVEINDKRSIEDVLDIIDGEVKNAVDADYEDVVEPRE